MNAWTKEEVLSFVAVAVSILIGLFAVEGTRKRNMLIVLLGVTLVGCYVFFRRAKISDRTLATQSEIKTEAGTNGTRAFAQERTRKDLGKKMPSELGRTGQAEITQDEAEREAGLLIARHEAFQEAQRQIETERTAARRRYLEGVRRKHAEEMILGRWSINGLQREYTRDGRIKAVGTDGKYRFVTADSIAEEFNTFPLATTRNGIKLLATFPDSLVVRFNHLPYVFRRVRPNPPAPAR